MTKKQNKEKQEKAGIKQAYERGAQDFSDNKLVQDALTRFRGKLKLAYLQGYVDKAVEAKHANRPA